jgi:hypothetical protein
MVKMKRPKLWKELERHPLSSEYEDLAGDRWIGLLGSIRRGFDKRKPIILYEHGGKPKILDGWQRQRACLECDVTPIYDGLPSGLTAEELVERDNDHRRHESPEQAAKRIEARQARVAAGREEGKSFRQIAMEEGISARQVQKDARTKGVDRSTPDRKKISPGMHQNTRKTVGVDGKTYPAERPNPDPPCDLEGKPKASKVGFDDRRFDIVYGLLVRFVDQRGNALGKDKHHARCQEILRAFLEAYEEWKKDS